MELEESEETQAMELAGCNWLKNLAEDPYFRGVQDQAGMLFVLLSTPKLCFCSCMFNFHPGDVLTIWRGAGCAHEYQHSVRSMHEQCNSIKTFHKVVRIFQVGCCPPM